MSFFDFKEKDIISTVYTSYPTCSLSLTLSSDSLYRNEINIYDSGTNASAKGYRTFQNIKGDYLSQSYYSKSSAVFSPNSFVQSGQKVTINRLRNIYFSSSFYKSENYSSASIMQNTSSFCHILSIPNVVVGSGIKPGSLSVGKMPFRDDGLGGMYSGSVLVGCVFYEYGVAVFGTKVNEVDFVQNQAISVKFSSTINTPMNVYMCEAPKSMLNFSLNPSYSVLSGTKNEITTEKPQTFITTIALYDENYEMVGVAKVANPILNQESDGVVFRLKLNF